MADEIPEADVEAAGRTCENDDDRHSALDAHQAAEDAHRQDRDTTPYVSHCVVCGKSGGQHPDGRWCGSEQYVTGDWTDIPIVNDVARAIGGAFHRGDDAWTTEALAAIAAARPHLTAAKDAEITRLRAELRRTRLTIAELTCPQPGDDDYCDGEMSFDGQHTSDFRKRGFDCVWCGAVAPEDEPFPSAPAQEGQTT